VLTGGDAQNYSLQLENGVLTVVKADQIINFTSLPLKSEIIVPTTNNLNSCFNVINVQRIVSPTSSYLGKSFASVIEIMSIF
jgi:hypothetical protein